jgi:biotin carboxyl carrier protein
VQPGATLGLIEVMKFFYPIRYEGSAPATIARCAIAEAAAVEAGATLFVFHR